MISASRWKSWNVNRTGRNAFGRLTVKPSLKMTNNPSNAMQSAPTPADKLDRLLATLDNLRAERERQEAQDRKTNEDKKLAKLRPWWMEAAQ